MQDILIVDKPGCGAFVNQRHTYSEDEDGKIYNEVYEDVTEIFVHDTLELFEPIAEIIITHESLHGAIFKIEGHKASRGLDSIENEAIVKIRGFIISDSSVEYVTPEKSLLRKVLRFIRKVLESMQHTITVLEINGKIESFVFTSYRNNLNICSPNSSISPTPLLIKIVKALVTNKKIMQEDSWSPGRFVLTYNLEYNEWKFLYYFLRAQDSTRLKMTNSLDTTMRVFGCESAWIAVNLVLWSLMTDYACPICHSVDTGNTVNGKKFCLSCRHELVPSSMLHKFNREYRRHYKKHGGILSYISQRKATHGVKLDPEKYNSVTARR